MLTSSRSGTRRVALALMLGLASATVAAVPARATAIHQSSAVALAPAPDSFTVGTLTVLRSGDHGRPVILLPCMACGAWEWSGTRAHLERDHVVYVVTFAGFDGVKAPQDSASLITLADSSLVALIRSRHIEKPVLIGHSLGGGFAIGFATEHSELLRGVVSVDAPPVFPGLERKTPAERSALAQQVSAELAHTTPEQFREQQLADMRLSVLDPDTAAKYAELAARSDPAATARYIAEGMQIDMRPALASITVPLLMISPFYAPDFANDSTVRSAEQRVEYFKAMLQGAPHVQVVSIAPARHFVMFDQPRRFLEVLDQFLKTLE